MGRYAKTSKVVVCACIIICVGYFVYKLIDRKEVIEQIDQNATSQETTSQSLTSQETASQWVQQNERKVRRQIRKNNYSALLVSAQRWQGVRELTGNNDHPMITKSMNLCGLNGDKGYAWCASCQAEIHYEAGLKAPKSARVVEWFTQNVVWEKNFGKLPKFNKQGMVGGMYYSKLGRLAHIILIVEETDKYYYCLEGNTSATGAIEWEEDDPTQREGDGFYKKIRNKESISALADYCLNDSLFINQYDWYLKRFKN